jgi:hypothetical protein
MFRRKPPALIFFVPNPRSNLPRQSLQRIIYI